MSLRKSRTLATTVYFFLKVQASTIQGEIFRDLERRNKTVLFTDGINGWVKHPK